MLNDNGRWPLRGDPPPIDQLLTDSSAADDWRQAWHQGMVNLGAAAAIQPATSLLDGVFDTYPGKAG